MKKLLALLLVVVVVGCGKRGDPRPPVPVIPQATSDLVVTQRASKVLLSWSYPSLSTAGKNLTGLRRVSVYRYVEELPVSPTGVNPETLQPGDADPTLPRPVMLFSKIPPLVPAQFEKLSSRIESIESANLAGATVGSRLVFEDAPPFRTQDGRPVRLNYAVVTEGEDTRSAYSNLATMVPLPVAQAPRGLTAAAQAKGVVLNWTRPERAVTGEEAPVIAGYNIYRLGAEETLSEFAVPINTAPITTTTYTDNPPYGDHSYRVSAVASFDRPSIESDASAPASATFKDLEAPPPPASVTVLIETKVVRLLWDPVEVPDLNGYNVYRTEGTARLKLTPHPARQTHFGDEAIQLGITYVYSITAVDKTGNESAPVVAQPIVVPKTP
ncbi:MAG TPA: hypothetical protein VF618_08250 [Thermoanaerobaculia bacterium]